MKSRDLHQVKGELNHSILQHHADSYATRLVGQRFVHMQDNDPSKLCQKNIKGKREHRVLQLMCSLAQSADLNSIEQVWDELDRKVRAKQHTSSLTSVNSCRKTGQKYPVFDGKNPKNLRSSDSGQRGSY